jgi:hypothetical protein
MTTLFDMTSPSQPSEKADKNKTMKKKKNRITNPLVEDYENKTKGVPKTLPSFESYIRTGYSEIGELRVEAEKIIEEKTKRGRRKRYVGRPSDYTEALAKRICRQVAQGYSIRGIVGMDPHVPSRATIHRWLKEYPEFRDQYAQATQQRAEALFDMCLEIACGEKDVQRARLIVDTLKWMAGKLSPKKYGKQVLFEGEVRQFNAFSLILQQMVAKPALLAEFANDKGNLALLADALTSTTSAKKD